MYKCSACQYFSGCIWCPFSLFLWVFASLVESDFCFYDRLVIATFFNFCNNGRIWWLLTTGFPRLPTGQYWLGGCAAHNLSFHGYCLCSSAVVHMKISKIWIIVKINMLQVYGHTARMWVMDGVREEAWYKLLREKVEMILVTTNCEGAREDKKIHILFHTCTSSVASFPIFPILFTLSIK